jgi:hypothetical protein
VKRLGCLNGAFMRSVSRGILPKITLDEIERIAIRTEKIPSVTISDVALGQNAAAAPHVSMTARSPFAFLIPLSQMPVACHARPQLMVDHSQVGEDLASV